jgi:hypothetical protein
MRKSLFNVPSDNDISHVADFAELQCLISPLGRLSKQDLERALGKVNDDEVAEGIEDEQVGSVSRVTDEAFDELARREMACGKGGYPFCLNEDLLNLRQEVWADDRWAQYLFLLVATRNNMGSGRRVEIDEVEIDGADLFEQLSAQVALSFLGGIDSDNRCCSHVIGTARRAVGNDTSGYRAAINRLCEALGELGGYSDTPDSGKPQDDGLDIVAWRSFSDSRIGKLLLFGQCKTGDSWNEADITRLNPRSLVSLRTTGKALHTDPLRGFFVSKQVSALWAKYVSHGVIIFDRCRLIDYGNRAGNDLVEKCKRWAKTILEREAL